MAKKSSEKKDVMPKSTAYAQARSMSQCGADTISIMKEQGNNAVFQQPFQVARKNQRSSSDPQSIQRKQDKSAKQTGSAVPTGLQAILQSNQEPTYRNNNRQQQISVIKEQESMEVETPVGQPRIVNIKKQMSFSKEQVNPVKTPKVDDSSIVSTNKMSKISMRKGLIVRDVGAHLAPATAVSQAAPRYPDQAFGKNFKSRKNSQLSSKNGAATSGAEKRGVMMRRSSKNSSGNNMKERPRNLTDMSCRDREGTMSSALSLDFDKMDKGREEDYSDFSKMISNSSQYNRVDDQRRRLESFLSLAQQAKSKRDISKIQDMIRQIDETGKPLPMSRINELRLLELMASPYNQSLIAMIQVELEQSRKVKELKKQQQSNQNSKSKFSED